MTKIDVFSGFLGAGKTTLIKKLLKEGYNGEKLVLIENEFGEIGIDGGFMKDAGIEVTEMNQGCICCSLVGDFGKALQKVLDEFSPDRILIEPSGVGKLSDVLKAVMNVGSDKLVLNSYTTVADATKIKMYMKNFGEFYKNQVETAKTIVLSRTQKLSEEKLDEAVKMIRELNEHATIVTTNWDDINGKQILPQWKRRTSSPRICLRTSLLTTKNIITTTMTNTNIITTTTSTSTTTITTSTNTTTTMMSMNTTTIMTNMNITTTRTARSVIVTIMTTNIITIITPTRCSRLSALKARRGSLRRNLKTRCRSCQMRNTASF